MRGPYQPRTGCRQGNHRKVAENVTESVWVECSSEWLREACKLQVDKTRPQACYVLLGITGQSYYLQANTFMFASMCTTAAV